jgi:hypothetical protein
MPQLREGVVKPPMFLSRILERPNFTIIIVIKQAFGKFLNFISTPQRNTEIHLL